MTNTAHIPLRGRTTMCESRQMSVGGRKVLPLI
jgi:hypothetical protein